MNALTGDRVTCVTDCALRICSSMRWYIRRSQNEVAMCRSVREYFAGGARIVETSSQPRRTGVEVFEKDPKLIEEPY